MAPLRRPGASRGPRRGRGTPRRWWRRRQGRRSPPGGLGAAGQACRARAGSADDGRPLAAPRHHSVARCAPRGPRHGRGDAPPTLASLAGAATPSRRPRAAGRARDGPADDGRPSSASRRRSVARTRHEGAVTAAGTPRRRWRHWRRRRRRRPAREATPAAPTRRLARRVTRTARRLTVPSGGEDPLPSFLLLRRQRRPGHIQPHRNAGGQEQRENKWLSASPFSQGACLFGPQTLADGHHQNQIFD